MLVGLPPNELSLVNTVIACVLAGALGIFVAPMTQLDPTTIALAVVPALAAALFARFTSFGIVVAAGLAMGIIDSLVTYFSRQAVVPHLQRRPHPGRHRAHLLPGHRGRDVRARGQAPASAGCSRTLGCRPHRARPAWFARRWC